MRELRFVLTWVGLGLVFMAGAGGCAPGIPAKPENAAPPVAPALHRGFISMSPNTTETVFALGQQSGLVAVGKFDDYPSETTKLPRVGGAIDPDLERITQLRPGLIMTSGEVPKVVQYGATHEVAVVNVAMDNLDGIAEGIKRIGSLLQCDVKADALLQRMMEQRHAVETAVAGQARPKVLLVTGRMSHDLNTLSTVGGPSFLSEIVTLAGGDNIYADSSQGYFEASKETVVKEAPAVVLEFHCGETLSDAEREAYVRDWDVLSTVPAVREHRVHIITASHAMRPGPRVYEVARLFARLLHPGVEALQ